MAIVTMLSFPIRNIGIKDWKLTVALKKNTFIFSFLNSHSVQWRILNNAGLF